jgi:hypothetical protein
MILQLQDHKYQGGCRPNLLPGTPCASLCGQHMRRSRHIDCGNFFVVGVAVHLSGCSANLCRSNGGVPYI